MPRPYPKGIRKTRSGWQAYIRRDGRFLSKHFKPETTLSKLKQWVDEQKAKAVLKQPADVDERETFGADCDAYLTAVAGMTTFSDRKYRIDQWRYALGPKRRRQDITPVEIRQQLETWKKDGLSHGSLNLRRTALMHLYTVLDGKAAKNPVKDVPRYREVPPPLKLPTLDQAENVIAAVRAVKGREKSRARLRVLLWTGWPGAQLARLKPEDLKLKKSVAFIRARHKGAGSHGRWLPLLPQAVEALQEFDRVKAWGTFSHSALHSSLHAACDRVKVPRFRVYDLRHLLLTLLATTVKDDRVVAEIAMHSDLRQTRRYTEQSVNPRLVAGLAKLAESLK